MEQSKSVFYKNTATYGAITGMALVIMSLIFYVLNIENQNLVQWIDYAIIIGGIFLGTKSYRDKLNFGSITYGKSLGSGVLISLFASILFAFYTYLFFKFIDPSALDKVYELVEQSMAKQGSMTDEQLEMAMEMTKKFTTPGTMAFGVILSFVFWGFLFSLITSIFLKKKSNPYDEAMSEIEK